MKQSTRELIDAEQDKYNLDYICTEVQRGRIRPSKYKHYIKMPRYLYKELRSRGIIEPEAYFINEVAFFESNLEEVTISFMTLYGCEDLHRAIDRYLVIKFAGSYPLKRGGIFF